MYTLKLALILCLSLLESIPIIIVGLADPWGRRVYPLFRFWSWCVLKAGGVTVRVRRSGDLDPSRAYVFMANHQSNIDVPVLVQALAPIQLRWMAKRELLRVPFFGWALWASKHVLVRRVRSKDMVAAMDSACDKLGRGISVVVFPEGTRSTDGELLPFKRGGFRLAEKAGVPIVPITVSGSGALLPRGEWRLRSGAVDVHIGEALAAEGRDDRSRGEIERVREVIAAHLSARGEPEVAQGYGTGTCQAR